MKSKVRRILAIMLTLVMLASCVAAFPLNAQAFDNDVKSGVVAIVFYLKGAGLYITDGSQYQQIQQIGDTEFSGGTGFFIGEEKENPQYIVTNEHVVDSYIKVGEGKSFLTPLGTTYQNYPVYLGAESSELRVYYDKNDYETAFVDSYGDSEKVDIAVIKIQKPTTKRHALVLQTPTDDMVGSTVYTVGFPGNADNQFTSVNKYGIEDATVHKGVMVQVTGPQYESPTEIKMFRSLGADTVGMSTVVETIAARHMGMRVCSISCVTNMAAGIQDKISHEEVKKSSDDSSKNFAVLVSGLLKNMK